MQVNGRRGNVSVEFIWFSCIIETEGDDSKLIVKNVNTEVSGDIIVTHLIGQIKIEDVHDWFNDFEKICQQFISEGREYKLLVDRKGYIPAHFSVQKEWKDKFFNKTMLKHSKAIAFLLEEGEIMNHLKQSNSKESVEFFDNYELAFKWLVEYSK